MTIYLYGSHASYWAAKTRCYLLKKGIPFVERLPGHPRFREHVRANTLNHRIPQVELADGTVIQDTVAIMDALEKTRFNKTAAAKLLGLSFRQLRYRIKKLGIE